MTTITEILDKMQELEEKEGGWGKLFAWLYTLDDE